MAIDKKLQIFDDEGNPVDYDILASDVKFLPDGKDLPTKLAEMEEEIGEGGYTPPAGGIPKTDLAPAVQTSLDKADTAYQKPQTGIPASDLASGVIPDVSGFATKTEVNAKANSADVYTKSQTDAAIADAIKDMPTGDIPTKVSELANDAGYQTEAQVASAISQAAIEAVVGNGDFAMTYDQASDTFNIVMLVPTISVSDDSLSFDSTAKVKTITVSGHNLKADIAIQVPTGWTASLNSLPQVNGTVAETQVTLTYGGAGASVATGNLVLTSGSVVKNVPLSYSQYGGPTITVEPASLSFEAIGGQSQSKTVTVGKFNITGDVNVAVSGQNADKFSASLSGSTLTVTYTPGNVNSGSHTATIHLSADGATTKAVTVSGTVQSQSLTITPASLSLQSDNGVDATGTINVKGTNIVGNVDLSINGTGFTLSPTSLNAADVNSANGVDVTVTANIASGDTASATISAISGLASASASAEWIKTETEPEEGSLVYRRHGSSSADSQLNDLPITFKVTTVATDNSDGAVRIVREDGGEGYPAPNDNYQALRRLFIPATISIAGKTYKVTELGIYVFAHSGVVYAEFETPSNITALLKGPQSSSPFRGANSFKGTGTTDNIETFTYPSSITSTSNIGDDFFHTLVRRAVIPDTVIGNLTPMSAVTHIDCGTGISSLSNNNWYDKPVADFIFRRTTSVVEINQYTAEQWAASTINRTIHVPSELVSSYESNTNWKTVLDAGKLTIVAITE